MTEDQKVAILNVLAILREAGISSKMHFMYGSSETSLVITLPKVTPELPGEEENDTEKVSGL